MIANYFRVRRAPQWNLYTYHVEFRPDLEIRGVKQRLLREQRELFNGYLFDGTRIFTPTRLHIPNGSLEIISRTREDQEVLMVIRFTGELSMRDSGSLQVLNLIIRRAMHGLNLQLIGRNFYDAAASVCVFFCLLAEFYFNILNFFFARLIFQTFVYNCGRDTLRPFASTRRTF